MRQAAEVNRVLGGRILDIANRHRIKRTYIVVADRRVAKIFMDNGSGLDLIAALEPEPMDFPKGAANRSLGRVVSSCGRFVRHRLEPRKAPGEQEALFFSRQIAGWLDNSIRENEFDRLILVAAPAMLGNLRKTMGKQTQSLVSAEVARDLTKMKNKDLYEELKKIVRL